MLRSRDSATEVSVNKTWVLFTDTSVAEQKKKQKPYSYDETLKLYFQESADFLFAEFKNFR